MEKANINGIEAQHNADLEKIRKERKSIETWVESLRETMVSQIEDGKVPLSKIENYERKNWTNAAKKHSASHQDLWNDFEQFWKSEGLDVVITDGHDGVGIKDWINISVSPLPERPRLGGVTRQEYPGR